MFLNSDPTPIPETFAAYFARYLGARKGYHLVGHLFPQLVAGKVDSLLFRQRGKSCTALAILHCDSHSEKGVSLTASEAEALAEACLEYFGLAGRTDFSVTLKIYDIGPGIIGPTSIARLNSDDAKKRASGVSVQRWMLDTKTCLAWTSNWLAGLTSKAAIEHLLQSPRLDLAERPRAIATITRPAFFTYGLMVLLIAVFWAEVTFGLERAGPGMLVSLRTLVALGGVNRAFVILGGEWWRLFTAPLLHLDMGHLLSNLVAIFLIGRLLEPLVGWRWMAAIFTFSALCGSLVSIAINAPGLICIGASGGAVGLFAASLVATYRIPAGGRRKWLIGQSIFGLVTTFLPVVTGDPKGIHIDFGAHLGGLIGGVAISLVLLALWPGDIERPKRPNLAVAIPILFFLIATGSLAPIRLSYAQQSLAQELLAPDWPSTEADMEAQAPGLVLKYPHDPRARLADAVVLLRKNEVSQAEADLRAGLSEKELLSEVLGPDIQERLLVMLAATLDGEGKTLEARAIARPACGIENTGFLAKVLSERSLCS